MIGKQIHNYKIMEKISEGGMGVVYRAEDTKLNRVAVLKFLLTESIADKESKERFLQEARATAALNHPNIVTVYEVNEHEDQMYIAMEFVEGETLLDKYIFPDTHAKKTLNIEDFINITVQVAIQICEGLKLAHQKGIIHRDIKPKNIMVDQENRVKILDFGTAKLKGVSRLTKKFFTLGTFQYMSPEQLRGEELDQRTDIWSLGVLMYEMLAGQLPFEGENPETMLYSILNLEPEPISKKVSGIPGELELIVEKALTKDRDN